MNWRTSLFRIRGALQRLLRRRRRKPQLRPLHSNSVSSSMPDDDFNKLIAELDEILNEPLPQERPTAAQDKCAE